MGVVAGAAVVGGVIHMAGGHEKQVRELAQANEQAANNPRTKKLQVVREYNTKKVHITFIQIMGMNIQLTIL
jgi:hypothetical protein